MHFFDRTLYLQICIWKQTFSLGKDGRYRLTFDWRFSALSQSEIRVHWWTHNSKNPTNLGRREFNSTLHQSSHGFATRVHGFATRVHGFATKTKALTHQIPPATQAITCQPWKWWTAVWQAGVDVRLWWKELNGNSEPVGYRRGLCLNPTAQKDNRGVLGSSFRAEEFSEIVGYSNIAISSYRLKKMIF